MGRVQTMSTTISALTTGVLVLAALAGCVGMPDDGSNDGTGTVSFFVKDAPSDNFTSVFVTFSSVMVHRAGGLDGNDTADVDDNETFDGQDNETSESDDGNQTEDPDDGNETESEDDASGAGWFQVVNSTHTVDLKQFQGNASAFLGEADVEAGKYTQIRIEVDEAYGIKDGARVNFTVPSGTLKITRPWTVVAGEETLLTVDFLLEESIVEKGNGGYLLKPKMKLAIEHDDKDTQDFVGDDDAGDAGRRQGGKPDGKG
ncbi:MAG TPA: DUF4382 domain-containing protein, partial [Candidatus Thermoplasmatota archaeon]|nr:DUF4382 domain-containing protein [Candidatus Thermoplasmatota archaeon]